MQYFLEKKWCRRWEIGVVRRWGWADLTGFCIFRPVEVRLVPLQTHGFKGLRPDFNRILRNLVRTKVAQTAWGFGFQVSSYMRGIAAKSKPALHF